MKKKYQMPYLLAGKLKKTSFIPYNFRLRVIFFN